MHITLLLKVLVLSHDIVLYNIDDIAVKILEAFYIRIVAALGTMVVIPISSSGREQRQV